MCLRKDVRRRNRLPRAMLMEDLKQCNSARAATACAAEKLLFQNYHWRVARKFMVHVRLAKKYRAVWLSPTRVELVPETPRADVDAADDDDKAAAGAGAAGNPAVADDAAADDADGLGSDVDELNRREDDVAISKGARGGGSSKGSSAGSGAGAGTGGGSGAGEEEEPRSHSARGLDLVRQ